MRHANLRIIAPDEGSSSTAAQGHDALASVPYNLLVFPGYEIRNEPLNLGLTEIALEPQRQASRAEATNR